jgi:hypothetical protein
MVALLYFLDKNNDLTMLIIMYIVFRSTSLCFHAEIWPVGTYVPGIGQPRIEGAVTMHRATSVARFARFS